MPLYIDNEAYPAAPDKNLLEHCLSLGFDLPYFCWHPALGSVGACRQCAVKQYKDENDERGRIVMACMTPAADETRIALTDPEARDFRASVIEWLMLNHPHDCPVCEEGGECHLQDMTVMTGHNYRRYRGKKRTFRNQDLGPFINHEMNRCIACYRCVRFYRDYAGGKDLNAFAAHHHVFFGRHEDGTLENPFSGNLAEICPTGVFTDKPFGEHYVRKWDLMSAPSVCVHCSLGCNTTAGERYGTLRRIQNRYNHDVNRYFLCDRGRYGYGFVNGERRVRGPALRGAGSHPAPASSEAAIGAGGEMLSAGVIGIGSPRASLEANFALRNLVGAENFYLGLADAEQRALALAAGILGDGTTRSPSLREAAEADAVLVLGEDPASTAPRLALTLREAAHGARQALAAKQKQHRWQDAAVRHAAEDSVFPLYVATPAASTLDTFAAGTYRATPLEIARVGFAVAHRLDADAPAPPELSAAETRLADEIAAALAAAERPLIIAGTRLRSTAVLEAAANAARALTKRLGHAADLALVPDECNSLGLALIGGGTLSAAFERARSSNVGTAVVLENDLYRRAGAEAVEGFTTSLKHLLVVDHVQHATSAAADLLLPAATFAESEGTLVNNEGRAQRFFQVFVPDGEIRPAWRWLQELARARGGASDWRNVDDVTAACAEACPALSGIAEAAPPASFRVCGERIRRAPPRYSGRTAMHADRDLHEPPPPPDPDAPLSFSMEGYHGRRVPGALLPYFWAPAWNSIQSVKKFQDEVGGPLRGGAAGRRLLEPGRDAAQGSGYFAVAASAKATPPDVRTVVPLGEIFGSEELSALSPPVAERIPPAYAALHPDDAYALGLDAGSTVCIVHDGTERRLPVERNAELARGVIGLPIGLPDLPFSPVEPATVRKSES